MDAVYEYIPMALAFSKSERNVMLRAVRVKEAVKPKLQRHLTFVDVKVPTVESVSPVEDTAVEVDNDALSEMVNKLLEQKNVPTTVKRMVLYTKALADKSKRVMEKTLNLKSNEVVAPTNVEESAKPAEVTETSGVIPDTWDKLLESVVAEPTTIVEPVLPTIEEKEEPVPSDLNLNLDFSLPLSNPEVASLEKEVTEPSVVEPIAENKLEEEKSLEFNLPNIKSTEIKTIEPEIPNMDFLKSWTANTTLEENNKEAKTSLNIENETKESDNFSTPTSVMARVKRIRNDYEEEKIKNASFQEKIQVLEGSNKEYKDKIGVLEAFVKDVVKENGRLTSENNQIKADKQKLEDKIVIMTTNSESELDKQNKSHADEIARLNDKMAYMEEQHSAEKEKMSADFAKKLEASEKKHSESMRALYSTISEALGEPMGNYEEEGYSKVA